MTTALKVTEKEWQQTVIDTAQARGWRVAHFRTSRTGSGGYATAVQADGAGYPDLSMVRGPRLAFVELKAEKGRLAPAQREWLDDLTLVADATQYAAGVAMGEDLLEPNLSHEADYRGCGVEVYVWKPADWPEVERTLR
jgi:hypothetical protein